MSFTNIIGELKGLVSMEQLSFQTGISPQTLGRYRAGNYTPSEGNYKALEKVYKNIQTTRLYWAGMSLDEAKKFSGLDHNLVQYRIEYVENVVEKVAELRGTSVAAVTRGFQDSVKTAEEIDEALQSEGYLQK